TSTTRTSQQVKRQLGDAGFAIPMIVPDLWTQAKWGRGSLAAADAATRREAVAEVKRCMDWAEAAGCPFVDVWPGQDGFDYPSRPTTRTPGSGSARASPRARRTTRR
ncbi:MAG: sugar phosphate isomerase/epimerase, partial [Desulfobacterales bacterium]|nr:sugar phosphate isomerase/epimerase [Desulfobacterales bacterium]